jgi:radical SAM superfamily enzyme YgiQ (UPF0313 family)
VTRPLSIYLGDLTYTTLSLATEAFPLNIGYVAALAQKLFGARVELRLFKYIHDLEQALVDAPPDVLALSNYPWNHAVGLELFSWLRQLRPDALSVMGGSNISHVPGEQERFLRAAPMLDAYVYLEGELGFSRIVERLLLQRGESGRLPPRRELWSEPLEGTLFLDAQGAFVRGPTLPRQKALDEFPSPYLSGLLDPFFDGKLSPMVETNRGCPFSCTFCHEGDEAYGKVNFFSVERVLAELEYIVERVPRNVHNLMFSDPNFGMYRRDLEICSAIARIQRDKGWPLDIFASTGKNNKERIAQAMRELGGTMQMWLSVQSMDPDVLRNIERENIGLDAMLQIQTTLSAQNLPSKAEVILGLPGETYESHIRTLASLVRSGIDTLSTYSLMLLHGTQLNTPAERAKWQLASRFRVLPRDFGELRNGRRVVEVEEVVVGTRDLAFEQYVALRRLHFIVSVIYNGKPCSPLFKLIREVDVDPFLLLREMLEGLDGAPARVRELAAAFARDTREELWDSEPALREHYRSPEHYAELVAGEAGANLLQKYTALSVLEASEDWVQFAFACARRLFAADARDAVRAMFPHLDEMERFCRARVRNIMGADRMSDTPVEELRHDYEGWLAEVQGPPLEAYRLPAPQRVRFALSEQQYRTTEDYLERFGRTHQGIGKALTKMNIQRAWRHAAPLSASPDPA